MDDNQKASLGGLARKLIQADMLEEEVAWHATLMAQKHQLPFVSYIVSQRLLDPSVLAHYCAEEFGLPLFDLSVLNLDKIPKTLIRSEMVNQHHAFPLFRRGNCLFVALSDPTNFKALDEIKYQTNLATEAILVEEHKFKEIAAKVLSASEAVSLGNLEEADFNPPHISHIKSGEDNRSANLRSINLGPEAEDAPIIRYVNKLIEEAVEAGSSDLHFEPYEKIYRIRFRQDGILYEHSRPPITLGPRLAARLKIMAKLDISERRLPQDGRFKMKTSNQREIDFRVSTCPTLYGEKVVMRVLDPANTQLDIDGLGFEDFQKQIFLNIVHNPQGMLLVTGPTGSGKTVTLYTALNLLNTTQHNISTCEDPVEINMQGINQVHVNMKAGLTFATALRSFLRQDPDVIMVGEIRDLETAEIAVKAAQTGHRVFSSVHTNSAADTITRLIYMGIPAYNLATSVSLILAQRLTRKLCNHCKTAITLPRTALLEAGFSPEEIPHLQIFSPKGCDYCKEGYKGRLGIYEMMPISSDIGTLIMSGGNAIALYQQAIQEGMWDLKRSGLNKVKLGLTSLEEVNRVIKN